MTSLSSPIYTFWQSIFSLGTTTRLVLFALLSFLCCFLEKASPSFFFISSEHTSSFPRTDYLEIYPFFFTSLASRRPFLGTIFTGILFGRSPFFSSTFCPFFSLFSRSCEFLAGFSFLFSLITTNPGYLLHSWGTDSLFLSRARPVKGLFCGLNALWVRGILGRGTITFSSFWGVYNTDGLINIRAAKSLLYWPYFRFPVWGRLKKLLAPFFIPTRGVFALHFWGDSCCF